MKPSSILDYNAAKIGVDKSDQMTCYNLVLRKSTKWYRKLAIELLLGTSIVNAWVIFNQFCLQRRRKLSILEFKESVAMSLISGIPKEKLNPRPNRSLICCCCCCLPDPFRGMGAWRKTMEPQKPGNSPGSGPEVIKRQRVAKE